MRTGFCITCNKRTQGKSKDTFLCRRCKELENCSNIKQHLLSLNEFDLGWIIGFIEGEGCFYKKTSVSKLDNGLCKYPLSGFCVMNTDLDVMQKFASLINLPLKGPYYKKKETERKIVWSVQVTGNKAATIIEFLKPHMSARRQAQIEEAINWQDKGKFSV